MPDGTLPMNAAELLQREDIPADVREVLKRILPEVLEQAPKPNPLTVLGGRFQLLDDFVQQWMKRANGKPYTTDAIRYLCRRGDIPTKKIGAAVFVDLHALAEQLSAQPVRRSPRQRVRLNDDQKCGLWP